MKDQRNQRPGSRAPLQQRARHKVELILEAAMRLLDKGGLAALTTNAVAEVAGVSIGTLYQYFANKEAILDALADREVAGLGDRVLGILRDPTAIAPAERVARVIRAVAESYGGRGQVHRLVMEHSLRRGGNRLGPLIGELVALLGRADGPRGHGAGASLDPADAFVLSHAFAGVMRAVILAQDAGDPPREAVEASLARLITGFVGDSVRR